MPRKRVLLHNVEDPIQVQQYIEAKARRSSSQRLKQLLKDYPQPLRPPHLRPDSKRAFELLTINRIIAGAVHIRGQVAEQPCKNCQNGAGPFKECVFISDYIDLTLDCCANCVWDSKTKRRDPCVCDFGRGI